MFVKTRAVFNAGAGGVWVVGSHPQNILHLRRTSFIKLKVLYKPTAPPEQIHRPDGPPCLPKKTIPASFPLVPSGRYVCKRNQTPSFPPSCRDGMLVTKHKADPWFAPAGQYALPSQEIMLRKGLGCLPKQHTAPNGAGGCMSLLFCTNILLRWSKPVPSRTLFLLKKGESPHHLPQRGSMSV